MHVRKLARKTEEAVNRSEMEARGTKTLLSSQPRTEPGLLSWTAVKGLRIVVLTVLWSGLGMGVGLFCGIIGVALASAILHRAPHMDMAYRSVSIPLAILCGSCAFLWNLMRTVQAVRRRRTH